MLATAFERTMAMYLKTLELFGFKSFADRTVVQFHEGITAIVGPNGCGKSNILDAVKWVLGEQSAKALRGEGMVDVIFGGTDDRKPVNMAEISLTFADCERELGVEWNEVRVSRRIYRDGRSEYQLNNAACRLRDIHNLFMDTGIGRSAYSIMEQGRIDQVLSSRPEERRAVFEEAAGITKYKTQKKEALRKLEHTEANLIRGADILREVKRQIGSLQRQAAKARRYKALQSDLQILDTHLSKQRYDVLARELDEAGGAIEKLRDSISEKTAALGQLETELVTKKLALEEIELRASGARERAQEIRSQITGAEVRTGFNRERNVELAALIRRHNEEITSSEARLSERRAELTDVDARTVEAENARGAVEAEMTASNAAADEARRARAKVEGDFDHARSALATAEQKIFRLRNELASLLNQKEGIDARISALDHELGALRETVQRGSERESELLASLESGRAAVASTSANVDRAKAGIAAAQQTLRETEKALTETTRTLQGVDLRRETLEQANREGAGLSDSAQKLLAAARGNPAIAASALDALGTSIEVAPDHIPAVEAALGAAVHAVAAGDSNVFEELSRSIDALKARGAALACPGLFPAPSAVLSAPTEATPLRGLVRSPQALAPLLDVLLAEIWLVADLATAINFRKTTAATFVTASGDLVSRRGIVHTAAPSGVDQSVLHRKTKIAELAAESDKLRTELAQRETARNEAAASLAAAAAAQETAQSEAQQARITVGAVEGQIGEIRRELSGNRSRLQTLERERDQNAGRQGAVLEKHAASAALVSGEESLLETLAATIASSTSTLESARAAEQNAVGALNDLRVRAAEVRQRVEGLRAQKAPLEARINELDALISTRRTEIDNYTARIANHEKENAELEASIATLRNDLTAADQRIAEIVAEREEMAKTISGIENSQRDLRTSVDGLRKECGEHEVRHTQARLRVDNLRDHVTSRYQIDIEDFSNDTYALLKTLEQVRKARARGEKGADPSENAEPEPVEATAAAEAADASLAPDPEQVNATPPEPQTIQWDDIEGLVAAMRQKLDGMGPVNLDAIEEFDELEQRQIFLEQQNSDLANAKAELLEAIARINKTTEDLFSETFVRLRENFQIMFRELFGGGRADLALMDSTDPLECGIEVIARPPGKQPQSISLLSGGERAMTALALLFAIYMVKPSPFCVLDEMDAPLDDSNISRFIRILECFTTQSQFVVISHNKRTIARSDYLYGVTMEQKGVSKLIGMRFTRIDDGTTDSSSEDTPGISESFGKSPLTLSEQKTESERPAPAEVHSPPHDARN